MLKPSMNDFPEYYRKYIEELIDKDILIYLSNQKSSAANFFSKIGEEKSLYRYESNKWSIKQIIGHICDSERIFVTRALHFARNDKQGLLR